MRNKRRRVAVMRAVRYSVAGVAISVAIGFLALSSNAPVPFVLEGPPLPLTAISGQTGLRTVPLQALAKADEDQYWVSEKGDMTYVQKRGAPIVTIINRKTKDVKHIRVDGRERFQPPNAINAGDPHSYYFGWQPSPHQYHGDGVTESPGQANFRRHLENFKRYMGIGAKGLAGESVVHAAQRIYNKYPVGEMAALDGDDEDADPEDEEEEADVEDEEVDQAGDDDGDGGQTGEGSDVGSAKAAGVGAPEGNADEEGQGTGARGGGVV